MPFPTIGNLDNQRGLGLGGPGGANYSPTQTLSRITQAELNTFNTVYQPAIAQAVGSLDDTSIVDGVKERIATTAGDAKARQGRELGRLGVTQTALQASEFDRQGGISTALAESSAVNNARLDQEQRNLGLRDNLINVGRGIDEAGRAGLSAAAQNETNRNNANDAAKAQADASQTAAVGSIASTLIMAAVLL